MRLMDRLRDFFSLPPGQACIDIFIRRRQGRSFQPAESLRILQSIEDGRSLAAGALSLFELEFIRPGNHRPPYELIGGYDDEDHGDRTPEHSVEIAGAGRRLQVRA